MLNLDQFGRSLRTLDRGKAPPSYVKRSLLGGIIGSIAVRCT